MNVEWFRDIPYNTEPGTRFVGFLCVASIIKPFSIFLHAPTTDVHRNTAADFLLAAALFKHLHILAQDIFCLRHEHKFDVN